MNKDVIRQASNIVALIATIVINALANILPLNGQTTGAISDRFPVYITPAGYVFSIWSIIYIGLISFAVYQALPAQRSNPRLRRLGYLFVLSCVANSAWIFVWHYNQVTLSLLVIVGLLASLIGCYLSLEIGRGRVSRGEQWLVRVPFSIYLGWSSVATIVNTAVVLYNQGWNGWGIAPETWTVIMLVIGTVLAGTMVLRRGDLAYALVIVWAFAGIAVKNGPTPQVAIAAGALAAVAAIIVVIGLLRGFSSKPRAMGTA